MLRFLHIRHLAVIEAIEIEFTPGFNVLTGETGAGKSIVVEAVDLLLGGRASGDLVRTGAESAQVQAILEDRDGRELIVRREVSASGRSRAFVDDTLVTAGALRAITGPLIDLHGQHEHQELLVPGSHLNLLDRFARHDAHLGAVGSAFERWRLDRQALEACQLDDRERAARLDLATFQLGEISHVDPRPGEDDELAAERRVLANADKLARLAAQVYDELYEADGSVVSRLGVIWKRLGELASLDSRFVPYLEQRTAAEAPLQDLALFVRGYTADLDASPERLQQVEDRLAALERLKRRHGPSLADVTARRVALECELDALTSSSERAASAAAAVEGSRRAYLDAAEVLSRARRDAAGAFAGGLVRNLADLAMKHTRCEVRFEGTPPVESRWTAVGYDRAEFYLAPNPGEQPKPLTRIASGGELSRVMLALKTLATTDTPGKTLIFDEVDAGIGGRVADVVGARLQALGRAFQVLCITHLPQVAAHAATHFRVAKRVAAGRTTTVVDRLDGASRVNEIARMIGGEDVTVSVVVGAREMLASRLDRDKAKGESEGPAEAKAKGRRGAAKVFD